MFTGIIEVVGRLKTLKKRGDSAVVEIEADLPENDLRTGDSVAVNGVCLTVTERSGGTFWADLGLETLNVTTFSGLKNGDLVNIERPMRLGGRLGGHLVQGHVDGVGRIAQINEVRGGLEIAINVDEQTLKYLVLKGSVAINGVSLTISKIESGGLRVFLIPHTVDATTFKFARSGDMVNLEVDIVGKYVEKLTRTRPDDGGRRSVITEEFLRQHGFEN